MHQINEARSHSPDRWHSTTSSTRRLLALATTLATLGCGSVEGDWASTQEQGTEQAFEQFLAAHPQGPHADEAKQRLETLVEEREWATLLGQPSEQGFRNFLERYPNSPHSAEAVYQVLPCRREAAGDVVFTRNSERFTGGLAGVMVACQAGTSPLTVNLSKAGTFASSATGVDEIPWSFIQPIDIRDVEVRAGNDDVSLPYAFGGTTMTQMNDADQEVATTSHGYVKQIGGLEDIRNGKARADYYWPLLSSEREITMAVPSGKLVRFALMFPGQADGIGDVMLDGLRLYSDGAARASGDGSATP